MKTYKTFLLGAFLMIWSYKTTAGPGGSYQEIVRLVSPGKKISVEIAFATGSDAPASKKLFYRVNYKAGDGERNVLPYSALGINTSNGSFTDHLTLSGLSPLVQVHDRYRMLTGKRALCENEGVEQTLHLRNEKGDRLDIVFRLYDNGVCFRYVLPGSKDSVTITGETTGFAIPHEYKRWIQEYRPEYEDFYTDSSLYKRTFWGFPALFRVAAPIYMLISEANITRDNCGSRLSNEVNGDVFTISLPAAFHEFGKTEPSGRLPYNTPWRVLIIGTLAGVFESTLITDVSKPAVEQNTSWIQPGPAAWVYWANNHGSKDFRIVKEYIDLAVAMHWPYVLIDWEWDQMTNGGTIEDAVSYAKTKGIRSLLWYNSGTAWLGATPVDRLLTHEKRVKEFSWLQKIGVKGIKVDFFAGDMQAMMSYYIDILEDAARYQLLVNFHGATVPRGWSRTYPNLISTEAVYGAEQYNNGAALTPLASRHNTILPFTRNVIGPMDYTPVTFTNSQHPHITTYAHELALSVVFESGIQHFADRPSGYYDLPEQPKEFLMGIPTAWDDSKLIDGEPGEKAVVARRKGMKWYIGGINGSGHERDLTLHFPFLGPGQHVLSLIEDGDDAKSFSTKTISVNKGSVIKVHCLGMGGFAGIILPAMASAERPPGALRPTTIEATYYVSPSGSDSNPGTLALPFATLQKARDVVKTVSGSMTGDIIVYLRGGTYTLSGSLVLDQSNSGTNGYNIKYRNYPGETPVISGGQAVTGWTLYDAAKNIYKATGVNFGFRQLYVNGTKAIRARTPNKGTWDSVVNFSRANKWITIHKSEIAAWNNFTKVEMAVQNWWTESYLRLSSYTTDSSNAYIKLHTEEDTVIFKRPYPGGLGDPIFGGAAYYFENAYEFIDAEGEWYRDADANALYYKPRAGETMASATVIAPKIDTLVSIRGTLDNPVHNIWFYGISFMFSNWIRPSNYGQIDAQAFQYNVSADMNNVQKVGHPPAAVTVTAAHDIRIERNIFRFLGATGLDFFYGTHDDVAIGNLFQHISGGGISAGKFVQDSTVDDHVPYNPADQREIVTNETISNNYITSVAEDYWGAVPIAAGYPRGLRIEHNEVDGSLYTGISVGYGWTPSDNAMSGNLIRYNYVHDYMQLLGDGGGIYTLSKQPGTSIDENYISKGSPPLEQGALYFDNGSSNMFARANVIHNVNRYVYLDGTDKYHIVMDNNYSDVTNHIFAGTGCSLTNMHIRKDNNWAPKAQKVINNAGLRPAYRNIRL